MNYKLLLIKYINYVGKEEGVSFINRLSKDDFSEDEICELNLLDDISMLKSMEEIIISQATEFESYKKNLIKNELKGFEVHLAKDEASNKEFRDSVWSWLDDQVQNQVRSSVNEKVEKTIPNPFN